jgi:L-lactate dehydrogenase complex protein LldG
MSGNRTDREIVMNRVQEGLAAVPPASFPMPRTAEAFSRSGCDREAIDMLLDEVANLGGTTRRIRGRDELVTALHDLLKREHVTSAAISDTEGIRNAGIVKILRDAGVKVMDTEGSGHNLASCDLGIVAADAVLPETGTVLLRTRHEQPQALSLLPPVCLVLAAPSALKRDLDDVFSLAGGDRHFVLVSGPSRTADIEKILTLGVHGPQELHLWICEDIAKESSVPHPF